MLKAMVHREFLGWDRPFLPCAVEWLLRQKSLVGMTVIVPTAQAGRRLRESLAEAAGALLTPAILTPGALLMNEAADAAPEWMDYVAWVEVLESVGDWSIHQALFPEPPGIGRAWASGVAKEMVQLRHSLQENGLNLEIAARILKQSVEAERWHALAQLEIQVETTLKSWGAKSRTSILHKGISLPITSGRIVLAGIADFPPILERALLAWNGDITALIAAPPHEADQFSPAGRALQAWTKRPLPRPNGSLTVVADPIQQAVEAIQRVAEAGTLSTEAVVGCADTEVGEVLAREFSRHGWMAFHPAATPIKSGLTRWFTVWREWLATPTLMVMADLLALPETGILVAGLRAQKSKSLAKLRDRWLITDTEGLRRQTSLEEQNEGFDAGVARELCHAADILDLWRKRCAGPNFTNHLKELISLVGEGGENRERAMNLLEWIELAKPIIDRVERGASFWLDVMISEMPDPVRSPPEDRVIDIQGWLELLHEPGSHLVLCGMNEGKVPARGGGDAWLSETARTLLGLVTDDEGAARDAFLYQTLLQSRSNNGRVDVLCGKAGSGGEILLPSRLLLATNRDELPGRVQLLFREVEPPEAGLRWQADWQWKPRLGDIPASLSLTSLASYLECPLRYYLKYVLKMSTPEPGRGEWSHRDYGNVCHQVLERWGRDPKAREYEKSEYIHRWLSDELDLVVEEQFGKSPPLAIRIQTESLRQRFQFLAKIQANSRVEGWELIDVERSAQLDLGGIRITARIDRVDRHRDTGRLRVIDYKTGNIQSVSGSHRKKITATSTLPPHLSSDCPAIYLGEEKGKPANFLWQNLQLPLCVAALEIESESLPIPCYFAVGPTAAAVEILEWDDFTATDLEAANSCGAWIAHQIQAGVFWPPNPKTKYDDYSILAAGRCLDELIDPLEMVNR